MRKDRAAAEVVGAIVLTSIVALAIAIVGYQWLEQIPTSSPPSVIIEIGCGDGTVASDFSCLGGIIPCDPDQSVSYGDCAASCPPQSADPDQELLRHKCLWDCNQAEKLPYGECVKECSDVVEGEKKRCVEQCRGVVNCVKVDTLSSCNSIFICHKGGDPLTIGELSVSIDGDEEPPTDLTYYNITKGEFDPRDGHQLFRTGDLIKIPITTSPSSVIVGYNDYRSGRNQVLAQKNF